ncbi:MAG: transglutaminase-like domain-containing protein [Fimbriimonas sp.]
MRLLSILFITGLAPLATAETTYLGLYLQGTKIGYSSYDSSSTKIDGKAALRSDSRTVMNVGLLGQAMTMNMDSVTWTTPTGTPIRLKFRMSSSGRVQTVDAVFSKSQIVATIMNGGRQAKKTLQVPAGNKLVDDPLAGVIAGQIKPGTTRTFYVLDPSTVDLVKNDVRVMGKRKTQIGGKNVDATLVEIVDPRATMRVYLSGKGDLLRVDGPMGIEMRPVSRKVAMGATGGYTPSVDLAFATSLKTDKPIGDPTALTGLKMRVTGRDLARLPSGDHQTVARDGEAWIVDVHPVRLDGVSSIAIAESAAQKPEWTKPSLYVPSDNVKMRELAKKIVGDHKDVKSASLAIRKYVHDQMRPNAGIGVLRDAREVLDTKEGVCRDYAILTATLLRAAGIPARLASGLVNWDGSFYYHAWAEAWVGDRWLGLDSTAVPEQITPAHVKLGEGSVETAFTFTFLDKVKLELLEARKD